MSIQLPEGNASTRTANENNTPLLINFPAGAFKRPNGADQVLGFFFRAPDQFRDTLWYQVVASDSTSHECSVWMYGLNPHNGSEQTMRFEFQTGADNAFESNRDETHTAALGGIYLCMVIWVDNSVSGNIEATTVICPVGGTARTTLHSSGVAASVANFYNSASGGDMITRVGKVASSFIDAWPGGIESVFQIEGTFPLDGSGNPQTSVIEDVADGTTTIDELADLCDAGAGGQKWTHFPLSDPDDLANAWELEAGSSGVGDATVSGVDATKAMILHPSGPLQPVGLKPTFSLHTGYDIDWQTEKTLTGATADVSAPGGTYDNTLLGGTIDHVQARLVDEDGTEIVGWTTIDASPSAGTFSAGTFSNVAAAAKWMHLEYRARDSSDTVLATVHGWGVSGPAVVVVISGQSQITQTVFPNSDTAGVEPPTTCRAFVIERAPGLCEGNAAPRAAAMPVYAGNAHHSSGIKALIAEIDALLPGIPIIIVTIARSETALESYADDALINSENLISQGVQSIKDLLPGAMSYNLVMNGHSSDSATGYGTHIGEAVTQIEGVFGSAKKVFVGGTQRYPGGGATKGQDLRQEQWDWYVANKPGAAGNGKAHWISSFNTTFTSDGTHPNGPDEQGPGRNGAIMGVGVAMGIGLLNLSNVQFQSAAIEGGGTTLRLSLGQLT